ncbi:TPA: methyl-accepting chemotaxis protein [Vibrio diabolicus]|nr:methyl-accepting chemotaxis protein [Vibrio diabolicus]
MDACQFKKSIDEIKSLQWLAYVYGEQVTGSCYGDYGATRCELERIPSDTTLCTGVDSGQWTQNTICHGNFQFTGNQCEGGTLFWGKDGPDTPIIPDDPIHDPDDPTGDIEDPSVLPDGSTNTVNPPDTDGEPDVEEPDTDESTDTAVLKAITGMNKDVNKALNDMNIDINQASADVQNQIIALNASMVTNTQAIQKQQINDNKIYENTKALIQQANADITTAMNKNTNAVNGVGDDVEKIAGAMDGIADEVSGISDTLDGIANTDTSGAGTGGTCIESQSCTGFYESGYPDGLGGLVSGQLDDLKHNTIDNFVNSFGDLDLSSAKRPSFVLPVPFFGDFSFEEQISFDWVFGFIRAVLIMTSVFAARRIIFGG